MLPPRLTFNIALLVAAVLSLVFTTMVLTPPYTGFNLAWDKTAAAMKVTRADDWVIAQGLKPGDRVKSIANDSGLTVQLHRKHVLTSVADGRKYFASREERINEIGKMFNLLSAKRITLELLDGKRVGIALDRSRPLLSLSISTWLTFLMALAAPLIAVWIWAWQQDRPETKLLLASGVGYFLFTISSAVSVYSIEMFYLPEPLHWAMRSLVDFGQLLYAATGTAVLLYYPTRLRHANRVCQAICIGLVLYPTFCYLNNWRPGLAFSEQTLLFSDTEAYVPMLGFFGLTIFLCRKQWLCSARKPVERAQTAWVILAWTLGPSLFCFFYLLPRLMGLQPLYENEALLNLTILTTHILLLLGIARLNLFQLEQHIGQAYQWTVVTVFFISLDILLVSVVNISPAVSTTIILIAVLWIYMPLRQWGVNRLVAERESRNRNLMHDAVVTMLQSSLTSSESARNAWRDVLQLLFVPATLTYEEDARETRVDDRGQALIVGENAHSPAIRLEYAELGARLFHREDTQLVRMLAILFEKLYELRDAFVAGQNQERSRIRRDLHDQIGHKLLSLIYAADSDKVRTLAQETIEQTSELIQALKHEPVHIVDLATRIRGLCGDACSHAGLEFLWQDETRAEAELYLASDQYLNVLNIVRELLSNTIRHAGASQVKLTLCCEPHGLIIRFCDNGSGFEREAVNPGNGLYNIQARVQELQASMVWDTLSGTGVTIHIPMPRAADYG